MFHYENFYDLVYTGEVSSWSTSCREVDLFSPSWTFWIDRAARCPRIICPSGRQMAGFNSNDFQQVRTLEFFEDDAGGRGTWIGDRASRIFSLRMEG